MQEIEDNEVIVTPLIRDFPFVETRRALRQTRDIDKSIAILRFKILEYYRPGERIPAGTIAANCATRTHFVTCALYGLADKKLVSKNGAVYARTRVPYSREYRQELLNVINAAPRCDRLDFNFSYCKWLSNKAETADDCVRVIAERMRKHYRVGESIPIFTFADKLNKRVETIYAAVDSLIVSGHVEKRGENYYRTNKDSWNETAFHWY